MAEDGPKIVLVVRPTRLDDLVARFATTEQTRFHVERLGADFSDYQAEHATYRAAMAEAEGTLGRFGRVQRLDRRFLPNFVFGPRDLVVVLGQDGLVANTLKYLAGQRVIGVNPDPARWDGQLLPFRLHDLAPLLADERRRPRPTRLVSMAEVRLNDGQRLLAVNDFFLGQRGHCSARYRIALGERAERQSSSGIIVSTGLGSTGWMRSIYAGFSGLGQSLADNFVPVAAPALAWDADELCFHVREPFPSRTTGTSLVAGRVVGSATLQVTSEMAENGVIFSDGMEADFLEFAGGATATVGLAAAKGVMVI